MNSRRDKKFGAFDVNIWFAQNNKLAMETCSSDGTSTSLALSSSSTSDRNSRTSCAEGISRSVKR